MNGTMVVARLYGVVNIHMGTWLYGIMAIKWAYVPANLLAI
jgi:hypothetical protein